MGYIDVLNDPNRIFNANETCVQLCPKTGKVVGMRGWRDIYEVAPGPEKSSLTFLGTICANGQIVTPMVIYPYIRIPNYISKLVPEDFYMASSESGWMRSETFYEFIANAFLPWLHENNVEKPVVLFVDGHKTHLTLQVSMLCEDKSIILYLVPPNTTHILQPADVSVFKPFKDYWRDEVLQFQSKAVNSTVMRENVAPLISNILKRIKPDSIVNGFRATGLYPLNPDAVDYRKCLEIEEVHEEPEPDAASPDPLDYKIGFECLKAVLGETKVAHCEAGHGIDAPIIDIYRQMKARWEHQSQVAIEVESEGTSNTPQTVVADNATKTSESGWETLSLENDASEPG